MSTKPIPLTPEGRAALEAELRELTEVRRPQIVTRVATAREEGDLSENFAYHDARQELGQLDGRVQTIQATLRQAVIIEGPEAGSSVVALGGSVTVKDEFGETVYRIVGPAEANIARGMLSMESPLGRALLGRSPGDRVSFPTPSGAREATVIRVGSN